MQSLSHIGNLVCGESCGKPQVLFSHVPLFQCIPKRLIAYVHLSSCLSPSAGVRASHYSSFLANSQYFLTARRFRLDCAFPFRFYLHLISHNLLSEPWVLAPIFRSVKDKYKSILKDKAFNRYGIKLLATKDLGITYHVGEVFHSIASGLRHVDEVIDYYGYQNGERIVHGTILGISIDNYVDNHRIISLPAIELLDNLLWLYHLKAYKNLFKDISISYLEEQIWKITHFIYDINGHLGGNSEGINIHHLYLAYKKQFAGLDFVKDEYYLLNCQANFSSKNCIFKNSKNWNEDLLFYSRHCRCFLKKMTRMIQIDTSDETIINIYKEAQQYVINKIACKGIIIETNPVSNANIGETIQFL